MSDAESAVPVDPDAEVVSGIAPTVASRAAGADWRVLAVIAAGGFAGGLSRYELGLTFPTRHGGFPVTTFAINVSGSFLLALLLVCVIEIWPPTKYVRPLFGVGFCGAYTTFSTWMVDTDRLLADRHYATAAGNLAGSLVAGLAATALGLTCGRAVVAHRRRIAAARADQSAAAEQVRTGS
jgi:fluoride exporter